MRSKRCPPASTILLEPHIDMVFSSSIISPEENDHPLCSIISNNVMKSLDSTKRKIGAGWSSFLVAMVLMLSVTGSEAYDYNAILRETLPDEGYYQQGDITVGVVLNIRAQTAAGEWGDLDRPLAMLIYYSVRYAFDRINRDPNLLPNTTLGIQLRDSTVSPSATVIRTYQLLSLPGTGPLQMEGAVLNSSYQAVAVIGPMGARTVVPIACVTTLYKMLLVAPRAGAASLENRQFYPYFYTTVPRASVQDDMLFAILKYFKWKLFTVVYVSLEWSINSVKYLSLAVKDTDMCLEHSHFFITDRGNENVREIAEKLKFSKSNVVIFMADGRYINLIIEELKQIGVTKRFFWIRRNGIPLISIRGNEENVQGSIMTLPLSERDDELVSYLGTISPRADPHDMWLPDFWRNVFGCVPEDGDDGSCDSHVLADLLTEVDIPSINFPVKAVYAVAHAIDKVISDRCPEAAGNRQLLEACVQPSSLIEAIEQVEVISPTETFRFIDHYIHGDFEIYQFQMDPVTGSLYEQKIGTYFSENQSIEINETALNFGLDGTDIPTQENSSWPESICSHPCVVGEFKLQGELPCCWECYMCRDNEYVDANDTGCITCRPNTWPDNDTRKFCVQIEPTYLLWTNPYGLTLSCLASAGLLSSVIILIIVIVKRERKVIKGSTWYLLVMILFGIKLANACVFVHIAKPTDAMCITARLGFHLAFTLIFGPLMVKVNRIFQVFLAGAKLSRKVFLGSDLAQQVMVAVIITIQVGLSVMSLVLWPAEAMTTMPIATRRLSELHCSVPVNSLFICSSFNMFLLLACSVLAFLARGLPDNFNESWYIFLSVSTTVFIWIAFFTTYLSAFYAYHQAALLAAALILNALVVIVALFAPKMYALLYIPDKDIKITDFNSSKFTGNTNVSTDSQGKSESR